MRRFFNGLVVLSLVLALNTTSAFAAARRDDSDVDARTPIKRIVQLIKKVVKVLDTTDMSYPKP